MNLTLDALGLGLQTIRLRSGMTLAEIAKVSGLSISFLSDIERDEARPSLTTLQKLATCYGEPFRLIIPKSSPLVTFEAVQATGDLSRTAEVW